MLPFLQLLADGRTLHMKELISGIANHFRLTEEERAALLPSGASKTINNRVGWARTYLSKAGVIEAPTRGNFRITDAGKALLATSPDRVDARSLMQYESFRNFRATNREPTITNPNPQIDETTPEETIEGAYQELNSGLASELLDTLKSCSPYFFEKVVMTLLQAMGYGGATGQGVVTPRSGDGGIDGVIYEDKLRLDSVCIQAKRWEATVGQPTVQQFVGSMDLHRSRKGVVLTTSRFSSEAKSYIERIEGKRVVLVDGEELCRLMIEHRVGVVPKKTYELFDMSQDFFDESV